MAVIPFGLGDWGSEDQGVPRIRLNNMYLTENPTSPDGFSRVSRPSLDLFLGVGVGPIEGIWFQQGSFNDDLFVVSDTGLFRINQTTKSTSYLGAIPGSGFCQFAGTLDRVIIAREGVAYSTDGVSVTTVTMPDSRLVGSVATLNGYFLLSEKDAHRFYWIEPGETNPDALDFASAERIPDPIISINVNNDEIWFLGAKGPEVWTATGDLDAPFRRIPGRVYNEGCAARATVVEGVFEDFPCLLWVTDTRSVVMSRGFPRKISNTSVEELLKKGVNLRAWFFRHNRHDFYVITDDSKFTVVYDLTTNTWVRWSSYERETFRGHLGIQVGSKTLSGDKELGKIWELGTEGFDEENEEPIVREIAGVVTHAELPIPCYSVSCSVNAGWSPSYDKEPFLELRWSDDLGATWSEYLSVSLGNRGEYRSDVVFRSLGQIKAPGRVFELRFADSARFRFDYAAVNDR